MAVIALKPAGLEPPWPRRHVAAESSCYVLNAKHEAKTKSEGARNAKRGSDRGAAGCTFQGPQSPSSSSEFADSSLRDAPPGARFSLLCQVRTRRNSQSCLALLRPKHGGISAGPARHRPRRRFLRGLCEERVKLGLLGGLSFPETPQGGNS